MLVFHDLTIAAISQETKVNKRQGEKAKERKQKQMNINTFTFEVFSGNQSNHAINFDQFR